MTTYKELRDNFFEEVEKIDVSKLSLGGIQNTYKEYAELLKSISSLPDENYFEKLNGMALGVCVDTPKKEG